MTIALLAANWSDAAVVLISVTGALVASYIGGRLQRDAQREDRREARSNLKADRREDDLRLVQTLMNDAQGAAAKQIKTKYVGTDLDAADIEEQFLVVSNLQAASARIHDEELTERLDEWLRTLVAWEQAPHTGGDPQTNAATIACAEASHEVNRRIGVLLSEL